MQRGQPCKKVMSPLNHSLSFGSDLIPLLWLGLGKPWSARNEPWPHSTLQHRLEKPREPLFHGNISSTHVFRHKSSPSIYHLTHSNLGIKTLPHVFPHTLEPVGPSPVRLGAWGSELLTLLLPPAAPLARNPSSTSSPYPDQLRPS